MSCLDEKCFVKSDWHIWSYPGASLVTVVEQGTMQFLLYSKTLILRKGAELLKRHEMVQLSLYLIQLSSAHNPLPDSKKLSMGFKHL